MTVKSETVFRTPWFEIKVVDPGEETSGTTDPYYCLVRPDGVMAFVIDREGAVVLVEQYRPPLGRVTLEMPAGSVEAGESLDAAVIREVLEETGLVCEDWYRIGPCRMALQREDTIDHFYVGLGAHKAEDYQRIERGNVRFLPRSEFLDLVKSNRFDQTAALGGLYVAEKIFGIELLTADLASIRSIFATWLARDVETDNGSDRTRPDQQ
jgi:ADP-ribose pyrophosphatase